jgi:hypothetical protein
MSKDTLNFMSPIFSDLRDPAVNLLSNWQVGGDSYNRSPEQPLIAANNDLEASLAFLNDFRHSQATLKV